MNYDFEVSAQPDYEKMWITLRSRLRTDLGTGRIANAILTVVLGIMANIEDTAMAEAIRSRNRSSL